MVLRQHVSPANSMTKLRKPTCKPVYSKKWINKLFAGLGSVRIVKNGDLRLENAALGPSASIFKTSVTVFYYTDLPAGTKRILSFFQLVSGRNSTNPEIWLVPGAGGIFSNGPEQRAESIELIYVREWISSYHQSFALFTLSYLRLDGKESYCK